MQFICPKCLNPIELPDAANPENCLCPLCGSTLQLEDGSTTDWQQAAGNRKVGKFEIIDTVGKGAFGIVYMARDSDLDRLVAIKVPRAGALSRPDDLQRFMREARSVAQLHHPLIVPIHEVGQHDG